MATKKAETTSANMVDGYEITVTGQYYGQDPTSGVKSPKFYKAETFIFPKIVTYTEGKCWQKKTILGDGGALEEVDDQSKPAIPNVKKADAARVALHLIRRHYLEDRLKEKYEGFIKIRTCEVFDRKKIQIDPSKVADVGDKDISDMTRSELSQFILIHDLEVTLSMYGDLGDAKAAVRKVMSAQKVAAEAPEDMSAEDFVLTELSDDMFS